ncbi:hypothetical protein DICVIV_13030 [Dictyocaulus viviparus]|uniref:Exonuclease domain-containing protein n=1 Tax=Dictyocaulus viviparus TaxID=29172 RepID=A0A0D8X8W4_DICVI|nr:hypothetical protein DICVIV_13030 [Dictyocaulus viviparus]
MMSYPCCDRPIGVAGCSYSNSHVTDTMKESGLADFYEAPQPMTSYDPRSSSARDLLFEVVNSNTILIGHGLESDLKALRIVHDAVVDTSLLFSRSDTNGRCFRKSLKALAKEELGVEIQNDDWGGHDSGEVAFVAMQLAMKVVGYYT